MDLVSPVLPAYALDLAKPEIEQMRFMEIPKSGDLLTYWESGAFSLSAKEMFDIIGGASPAEQFDTPVVTRGQVEIDGQAFATLNVGFGSSLTACFVFAGGGAGSAGNPESAPSEAATYARSFLLGGLVELYADGGERRFLMDNRGSERVESGAPALFGRLSAEYTPDNKATQPGSGGRPAAGGPGPTEALPLSGTTGPSLALFMAGWAGGTQIAAGLSTPSADDAVDTVSGVNAMAEVAVHAPGNPADVLLTVDTVLPDAMADLVRLQNADLAMVPTYVVGAAPATPLAPPRLDDRPDLGLAAQVVGLDEFPGAGSLTPASTDRFFEQLAWADSGRGVAAGSRDLGGIQPGAIDVGDAAQAAAPAQQSAVPTAAAPAFREWLDGLLQQGEKGAVMVPVLALEGLMAFVYWRGSRPDRQAKSPQRSRAGGTPGQAPKRCVP